jgi:hypothetical protein
MTGFINLPNLNIKTMNKANLLLMADNYVEQMYGEGELSYL